MSGGGGGGKGSVPVAPAAPDNSAADRAAAEMLAENMRSRIGRSANINTSGMGLLGLANQSTNTTKLGG